MLLKRLGVWVLLFACAVSLGASFAMAAYADPKGQDSRGGRSKVEDRSPSALSPRPSESERCYASLYGRELAGSPTATGELFDPKAHTAAHPYLPLDSYARVKSLSTGESIVVRINDRGPEPYTGRCIDLSMAAAHAIGIYGVDYVRVTPL
jgi:rare lipoprotein A (peptidoglycan hydrolase)